jgi:hypothetical protein
MIDGLLTRPTAVLLLCFILAQSAPTLPESEHPGSHGGAMPEAPLPTRTEISHAIDLSADYLESACGKDGKFVYDVDINTRRQASSYNIFRHAGAMYALGMLNRSKPDPKVVNAMVRAAKFMRQNYVGPGAHPDQLVVWSGSARQRSEAELGATGLGLVALTEVRRVAPKLAPLEDLKALGRFVLFLQGRDGGFVLMYRSDTGPDRHFRSQYSPGEAALGLIALYDADPSREWLTAAGKALSYIARNRPEASQEPPDQWALIAIARLFPYCDKESCPGASHEELDQYAIRVCDWIVRQQLRNPASPLDGAFDPAGQPAVAAAFMEGLLAALEFLPNSKNLPRVEAAAGRSIAFLLRMQIGSGPFAGGMPGALRTSARSSSEVRIDYVQHALSAWLRYDELCQKRRAACLGYD